MASPEPAPDGDVLPAGGFSAWRHRMLAALEGTAPAEVPCGGCTACCRSSMFVHIGPDEVETLRRVPRALLVPAPGRPPGHVVLGYDRDGRCPMLVDDRCSIYEHRPRTCRAFDCRVFPAAGVFPDEDRPLVARQARRWRFEHPTAADRAEHQEVQAAAARLRERPDRLPGGVRAGDATALAVLAVETGAAGDQPGRPGRP